MNQRESEFVALLQKSCDLTTNQDFEDYIRAIEALRASTDKDVLKCMISCIRDVEGGEVQYELVEACEAFDEVEYVGAFISEVPKHWNKAQHWYTLMLCSLLNAEHCKSIFISRISDMSPETAKFFYKVVSEIGQRINTKYDAIACELKKLLG